MIQPDAKNFIERNNAQRRGTVLVLEAALILFFSLLDRLKLRHGPTASTGAKETQGQLRKFGRVRLRLIEKQHRAKFFILSGMGTQRPFTIIRPNNFAWGGYRRLAVKRELHEVDSQLKTRS